MEKAWSMALMEYNPNGKGVMAPIEYTLMIYSPSENVLVLLKIVF